MHQFNDTNSNSVAYWKEEGNKHYYNEACSDAIECYNKATLLSKGFKEVFLKIGLCYVRLDRYDEALYALNRAIQIDNHYTATVLINVNILKDENFFQKAVETIDSYSASGGDNPALVIESKNCAARAIKDLLVRGASLKPHYLWQKAEKYKKPEKTSIEFKYIKAVLLLYSKHDRSAKCLNKLNIDINNFVTESYKYIQDASEILKSFRDELLLQDIIQKRDWQKIYKESYTISLSSLKNIFEIIAKIILTHL